jgi:hypothetical protein
MRRCRTRSLQPALSYATVLREIAPKQPAKTVVQAAVNWYLKNHIDRIFAGGFADHDYTPLKPDIPIVADSTVNQAAQLLRFARRPVVVLGSQATLPPVAADKLAASLNEMGFPCFLGGMTRGLLGVNSPIHIRQQRGAALKEADVVLMLGSVCDFRMSYGRSLSRKSKVIVVNRDKSQLYKNADMFWSPTVAALGDVRSTKHVLGCSAAPPWMPVSRGWTCVLRFPMSVCAALHVLWCGVCFVVWRMVLCSNAWLVLYFMLCCATIISMRVHQVGTFVLALAKKLGSPGIRKVDVSGWIGQLKAKDAAKDKANAAKGHAIAQGGCAIVGEPVDGWVGDYGWVGELVGLGGMGVRLWVE